VDDGLSVEDSVLSFGNKTRPRQWQHPITRWRLFCWPPTIATIFSLATHHYISSAIPVMRIVCACTLLASIFVAWFQTHALRFRVFETSENAHVNYQKVMDAIGKTDWHISQHHLDSRIVSEVPGAGSWGERVEVRFHGTNVYVNSICDPSKRPQLIAFGDNISNITYIRRAVMGI
jgi:hypothetical protein